MAGSKYLALVSGVPTQTASLQTSAGAGSAGSIIAANSSGLLDITFLTASAPSNGQLLVGNGTNFTVANITSGDSTVTITNGSGTLALSVDQANLALGSIGGSLSLSSQVGSSILPPANGGTGANNTATSGHILVGKTGTNTYVDATPGSSDSTVTWTLGSGTLTAQVNQSNLTLSNLGGNTTISQGPNLLTVTVSETIAAGALINLYSNGGVLNVRNADQTSTSKKAHGFALTGASSGTISVCIGDGPITGLSGLTLGTEYFLSTVGAVTATPPSTATYISQYVGIASSSTVLQFIRGQVFEC